MEEEEETIRERFRERRARQGNVISSLMSD